MFAIAGYISKSNSDISAMLNHLSFYKDGKTATSVDYGFCLGAKQLSEKSPKPVTEYSTAKGYFVAFSGKIYNNALLKSELNLDLETGDDAELVVNGFIKQGSEFIKKLSGMFAFAIYNANNSELTIARDGCGMKPIYYYINGEEIAFSSGTRAFSDLSGFEKRFNEEILSAFLCYGHVPTSETFFKGVYRLEPGHILRFKDGKAEKERFFELEFAQSEKSEGELIEKIHNSVVNSIARHTENVNFSTFLSSGVDSSYIASVAKPRVCYTAGYSDQQYDESVYTKELASALGIENRVATVTPEQYLAEFEEVIYCMDEPLSNPSVPSIYFGSEFVARDCPDVIISGEGADELFGGYNSYKEEITHSGYMKIPYFIRHLIYLATKNLPIAKADFFARRGQKLKDYHIGLDRIFWDKDAVALVNCKNQKSTLEIASPFYKRYEKCSTFKQRQALDFYFWLINDFVHCVGRSADKFGLQSRFPLLDKEVIEVAIQVPDGLKLKDGMTKWAFRMAAKKVIPNDAHSRKKLGFPVPLKEWIKRDDYYQEIKAKFESDVAKEFFKQDMILKLLEDHVGGVANNYKKIWTIYTFIVWYKLNF